MPIFRTPPAVDALGVSAHRHPFRPGRFHQCGLCQELRRYLHHPHLRAHPLHLSGRGVLLHRSAAALLARPVAGQPGVVHDQRLSLRPLGDLGYSGGDGLHDHPGMYPGAGLDQPVSARKRGGDQELKVAPTRFESLLEKRSSLVANRYGCRLFSQSSRRNGPRGMDIHPEPFRASTENSCFSFLS